jgi:hypothetical protein
MSFGSRAAAGDGGRWTRMMTSTRCTGIGPDPEFRVALSRAS